jgi:hypothetical protein
MPTRPDASSAPQRQPVKLVAMVAVVALAATVAFALIAVTAPGGASLQRWGGGAAAVVSFAVALAAHRRLRNIRWNRLVKED